MTFSSYGCIGIGLIVSSSIPYRLHSSQIEVLVFFLFVPEYSHTFLKGEISFIQVCGYFF